MVFSFLFAFGYRSLPIGWPETLGPPAARRLTRRTVVGRRFMTSVAGVARKPRAVAGKESPAREKTLSIKQSVETQTVTV